MGQTDEMPEMARRYYVTRRGALRFERWLLKHASDRLRWAVTERDRGRRREMREEAQWWRHYMRWRERLVRSELSA